MDANTQLRLTLGDLLIKNIELATALDAARAEAEKLREQLPKQQPEQQ